MPISNWSTVWYCCTREVPQAGNKSGC